MHSVLLVLCATLLGACNEQPRIRPEVPVVIYVIDGLRADRLGVYGGTTQASPSVNIDALAANSVVFEAAYAPAPWTLPSIASIFTSTWPCEHQLLDNTVQLGERNQTLATRLGAAGYETVGMSGHPLVGERTGLARGFIELEAPIGAYQFADFTEHVLTRERQKPLFLYLHTIEPTAFYRTDKEYTRPFGLFMTPEVDRIKALWLSYRAAMTIDIANQKPRGMTDNSAEQELFMTSLKKLQRRIVRLYDASIYQADNQVGDVMGHLTEAGILDQAIVILLSSHGTELGDHGGWSHEQGLYDELVRVPLIIHFPGGAYAGQRVATPVSLVDVMPTVFDYLQAPGLCADCSGKSLLGLLTEAGAVDTSPSEVRADIVSVRDDRRTYYKPWQERRGNLGVALRQGGWKAIWNAEPETLELYNLEQDPIEAEDVSQIESKLATKMADQARQWLKSCNENAAAPVSASTIDAAEREQLQTIGHFE